MILSNVNLEAIDEPNMYHAKWVNIKKDRRCNSCNRLISKGTRCVTSTDKMNKHRIWTCKSCIVPLLREVEEAMDYACLYNIDVEDF